MGSHIEKDCENRVIKCMNYGCNMEYKAKYLNKHENECQHAIINCQFKSFGCDYIANRKNMMSHLTVLIIFFLFFVFCVYSFF